VLLKVADNLLKTLWEAVVEKKAIEPLVLDLNGVSGVTDFFLICSGSSTVQVRAIADSISDKLKELELPLVTKEGYADGRWILMDFGSVVVHNMYQTEREFYALEKLWHDAKSITEL
jgi:ribosome-associated protein